MKYCKFCEEARDDHLEDCPICGLPLEAQEAAEPATSTSASSPISLPGLVEPPRARRKARSAPEAKAAEPEPEPEPEPALETEPKSEEPESKSKTESEYRSVKTDSTPVARFERPAETPTSYLGSQEDPYEDPEDDFTQTEAEARTEEFDQKADEAEEQSLLDVIGKVNGHLRRGFDLFGLVGHPGSGKTHTLKALTYLLKRHGVDGDTARIQFHKTAAPEATRREVFDFAYTGPAGERWVFVDAGGELYLRLHENDWEEVTEEMTALARWLQSCKGLFFFLHLNEHHFGRGAIDRGFQLDEEGQQRQRRAQQAQEELAFFRSFLLFLRAIRFEKGGLRNLIQRCRESESLEKALVEYHQKAPRLDIPVMFFFSQADSYLHQGFEILPGEQFSPRRLSTAVAPFVARYLPGLFADVASQVKRFKFDFLQSYEEIDSGEVDVNGQRIKLPVWEADPQTPLSVSLLAGLEFLLRNQPQGKRFWNGPGISTLKALNLHRRLNPKQWKNVPLSLRHIELSGGGGR